MNQKPIALIVLVLIGISIAGYTLSNIPIPEDVTNNSSSPENTVNLTELEGLILERDLTVIKIFALENPTKTYTPIEGENNSIDKQYTVDIETAETLGTECQQNCETQYTDPDEIEQCAMMCYGVFMETTLQAQANYVVSTGSEEAELLGLYRELRVIEHNLWSLGGIR